jgi:hypothetical protein
MTYTMPLQLQNFMGWYLPYPKRGSYNLWTGRIRCSDIRTCYHEIGHKIDHEAGWISKSFAFKKTIDVFVRVQWFLFGPQRHPLAEFICKFPGIGSPRIPEKNILSVAFWTGGWGGYTELYADILAEVKGDLSLLPEDIAIYYSDTKIKKVFMEVYYG